MPGRNGMSASLLLVLARFCVVLQCTGVAVAPTEARGLGQATRYLQSLSLRGLSNTECLADIEGNCVIDFPGGGDENEGDEGDEGNEGRPRNTFPILLD